MSRTFYYRQIQPEPEGEYIELALGVAIQKEGCGDWGESVIIVKGDHMHSFVKGLAASGTMKGADELEEAIRRLGKIEVYVRF
jgi:hypothetical protein